MMDTRTAATFVSPVMEARRWLAGVEFPPERPLINISQAAPFDPPPEGMCAAMAEVIRNDPAAHCYGPVLGLPDLREEVAVQWQGIYGAPVSADQVAITSGCNQAFAAALMTLTREGDEVIIPTPWYFNHKMWCDMTGVRAVPLAADTALMPDPDAARALITPRTRAIVLVTPNNPGGVEYPPALLRAFYRLAQETGTALIIDETYRDFHSLSGAPHDLFRDPDWDKTLIQLYSFSKAYRMTGHRLGAMIAAPARLAEAEKFLDAVTICPNQPSQHGALWAMRNLGDWLAGERKEILARRAAINAGFPRLAAKGWHLRGAGAYFAYVEHPFALGSGKLAPLLIREAGVLLLPGTMFHPEGTAAARRELRIAYANIDTRGIATLFERLNTLSLSPRI